MEGAVIAAIAASGVALVAFALLATMFWRGRWLVLLAGSAAADPGRDEACRALGRHMAVVLMAAGTLMATLVVFLAGELARSAGVVSAASMANNVAFVALVVVLVWFFIVQRPDDEQPSSKGAAPRRSSLDHLHAATIVFVVAVLAVVGAVGAVAAGL
ncbi:hypothetical protein [Eggerthella timonensis]|uniref:hypothetical protein n=1 Tax=Eggerthella timonensis TaxID=1871008 RepID=UPI000C75CEBB|nr:hypothetical protein [Eggerthella timonensis]